VHSGAAKQAEGGAPRARSRRRSAPPLTHFRPDSLTYSVTLYLKRQYDRTLGAHSTVQGLRGDTVLWVEDASLQAHAQSALSAAVRVGFGRIVVSEIEAPRL
jgi:hypothetical protein